MRATNPYVAGNPVGDTPVFVGREDVLDEVFNVIESRTQMGIVLYGQRRIGKTSILQKLKSQMDETDDNTAIDFDLQYMATKPLDDVITDLANRIATALKMNPPVFKNSPAQEFQQFWLPAILNKIGTSRKIVILFDEFDIFTEQSDVKAGSTLFPYLSELLKISRTNLKFVFVLGRNIDDISAIAYQFLKGIHPKRISLLSREYTECLIRISEKEQTLLWEPEAVEAVWDLTHGHPYLSQTLCHQIWEKLRIKNPSSPPTVTAKHVHNAIPDTFEHGKISLQWLWNGLGPAEKIVVSALAQAPSRVVDEDSLNKILHDSGIRIKGRELYEAPKILLEWDILEPVEKGFRFKVELLRRWIKENKSLTKVYEENDNAQPIASDYYQIAKRFYNDNKPDIAIQELNRAIDAHPSHQGANQLLAEILIQQKKLGEARTVLENCVEIYPHWAKPRLIYVLLQIIKGITDPGQLLSIFEQILKMDSSQPDALKGKWDILRSRIEVLEKVKNYQEAFKIAKQLNEEYPDQSEWSQTVYRIEQKIALPKVFKEAKSTINVQGKKAEAINLFLHILNVDPYYPDAAKNLYNLVRDRKGVLKRWGWKALFMVDDGLANWIRSTILWIPSFLLVQFLIATTITIPTNFTWINASDLQFFANVVIFIGWVLCIWLGRSNVSVVICAIPLLILMYSTAVILGLGGMDNKVWIMVLTGIFVIFHLTALDDISDDPKGIDILAVGSAVILCYLTPILTFDVGVVEIVVTFLLMGAITGLLVGFSEGAPLESMGIGSLIGIVLSIIPAILKYNLNGDWFMTNGLGQSLAQMGSMALSYMVLISIGALVFAFQMSGYDEDSAKRINLVLAPIILAVFLWIFLFDGWYIIKNLQG